MHNPRLEDHAVGVELQMVELVEQQQRAIVQERHDDAARIQREIDALRDEMTRTAEKIAQSDAETPEFHDVEQVEESDGA
jgi:uncharacterized membrane protein